MNLSKVLALVIGLSTVCSTPVFAYVGACPTDDSGRQKLASDEIRNQQDATCSDVTVLQPNQPLQEGQLPDTYKATVICQSGTKFFDIRFNQTPALRQGETPLCYLSVTPAADGVVAHAVLAPRN